MRTHDQKPFFLSGAQRALTLQLQTKTENLSDLCYAYLFAVHYDRTGSIKVRFSFCSVLIEGQCLSDLHQGLAKHTVTFVREADPERDIPEQGKVFVRAISVCDGN